MAQILFPGFRATDANGNILAGAKLNVYEAGTTTPLDVYTDSALTTPTANPIVADSGGYFGAIYAAPDEYKFVLTDSADVTVWTLDNVTVVDPETATAVASESVTSNRTIAAADLDKLLNVSTASGDVTITADSATLGSGFEFSVRKTSADANDLIVSGTGVQTINGSTTYTIGSQFGSATFKSNGAGGWDILYETPTSTVPTATVFPFAGTSAPSGFLLCYGQAVSRTTYANLFAIIGTTYGVGDGSTTFNLPDLRGRVVAGKDDMGGSSANRLTDQTGGLDGDVLGDTGGAETHTLTTAQMPAHTHSVNFIRQSSVSGTFVQATDSSGTATSNTTESTGGGGAHNNVQPTIILNYIIKT